MMLEELSHKRRSNIMTMQYIITRHGLSSSLAGGILTRTKTYERLNTGYSSPSSPEIADLETTIGVEEDSVRLQIAVQHVC